MGNSTSQQASPPANDNRDTAASNRTDDKQPKISEATDEVDYVINEMRKSCLDNVRSSDFGKPALRQAELGMDDDSNGARQAKRDGGPSADVGELSLRQAELDVGGSGAMASGHTNVNTSPATANMSPVTANMSPVTANMSPATENSPTAPDEAMSIARFKSRTMIETINRSMSRHGEFYPGVTDADNNTQPTDNHDGSASESRSVEQRKNPGLEYEPNCPDCGTVNEYDYSNCDPVLPRICAGSELENGSRGGGAPSSESAGTAGQNQEEDWRYIDAVHLSSMFF